MTSIVIVNHAKHQHRHHAIAISLFVIKTIGVRMSASHVTVTSHFVINQIDARTNAQRNPCANGPTGHHSANALSLAEKVTNIIIN